MGKKNHDKILCLSLCLLTLSLGSCDVLNSLFPTPSPKPSVTPQPSAAVVTTLAGGGSSGGTVSGSVNGTGQLAKFFRPTSIAVDTSGVIYVADSSNNLVRQINSSGAVTTLAGSLSSGHADGTGTLATFYYPTGVAVDGQGNCYVADQNNNLIRKIAAGVVSTLAGGGSVGGTLAGHLDGTGVAATFYNPCGLAVDGTGSLIVADTKNNLIRKITPSGVVTTVAGGSGAGNNYYGYLDGIGTAAVFHGPTGVAVDSAGNIYVADQGNNRIRKIDSFGVVTTFAGGGTGYFGTLSGAFNGQGTAALFYSPFGIAVDAANNLYVADQYNNLIRKLSPSGLVTTTAGVDTGNQAPAGYVDGVGNTARFNAPTGVAVDVSGNLLVADQNNNLIRKIQTN